MSIAVAIDNINVIENMNLSLVVSELDKDYFDAGCKRFKEYKSQTVLQF